MRLQKRIINFFFSFQPTVVGFLAVQFSSISFMDQVNLISLMNAPSRNIEVTLDNDKCDFKNHEI